MLHFELMLVAMLRSALDSQLRVVPIHFKKRNYPKLRVKKLQVHLPRL